MPNCDACGEDRPEDDLKFLRNHETQWVSVCNACLAKGVNPDTVQPAVAEDEDDMPDGAGAKAEGDAEAGGIPPILIAAPAGETPYIAIPKLLAALRNLRLRKERRGKTRAHERRALEIAIRFALARDDTYHDAVIRDISPDGMSMTSERKLERGQLLQFDTNLPLPPAVAQLLKGSAEVRRAVPENGGFSYGLRFVQSQSAKGANRRRFRRFKCEMAAYYRRDGSACVARGDVRDVSQGGVQMFVDEKLEPGEIIRAHFRGRTGPFAKNDLIGTIKVGRVLPRGLEWEAGCAFVQMKMESGRRTSVIQRPATRIPRSR